MVDDFSDICIYILRPDDPGANFSACAHTDITTNPNAASYRYANGDCCPHVFPDA